VEEEKERRIRDIWPGSFPGAPAPAVRAGVDAYKVIWQNDDGSAQHTLLEIAAKTVKIKDPWTNTFLYEADLAQFASHSEDSSGCFEFRFEGDSPSLRFVPGPSDRRGRDLRTVIAELPERTRQLATEDRYQGEDKARKQEEKKLKQEKTKQKIQQQRQQQQQQQEKRKQQQAAQPPKRTPRPLGGQNYSPSSTPEPSDSCSGGGARSIEIEGPAHETLGWFNGKEIEGPSHETLGWINGNEIEGPSHETLGWINGNEIEGPSHETLGWINGNEIEGPSHETIGWVRGNELEGPNHQTLGFLRDYSSVSHHMLAVLYFFRFRNYFHA